MSYKPNPVLVLASLMLLFATQGVNADENVTCESIKKRYTECPVRIDGEVELEQQLSRSACVYGRSWGYERDHIWVDDGCRAEFVVVAPRLSLQDQCHQEIVEQIRDQYGWQDIYFGEAESYYQSDGGEGLRGQGYWRERGHEQHFEYQCASDRYRDRLEQAYFDTVSAGEEYVDCASVSKRYQFCDAYTERGVELVEQFSRSSCDYGRSWGYERDGIWVDHGCRARFRVGVEPPRHNYDSYRPPVQQPQRPGDATSQCHREIEAQLDRSLRGRVELRYESSYRQQIDRHRERIWGEASLINHRDRPPISFECVVSQRGEIESARFEWLQNQQQPTVPVFRPPQPVETPRQPVYRDPYFPKATNAGSATEACQLVLAERIHAQRGGKEKIIWGPPRSQINPNKTTSISGRGGLFVGTKRKATFNFDCLARNHDWAVISADYDYD